MIRLGMSILGAVASMMALVTLRTVEPGGVTPHAQAAFTSTRHITSLAVLPDGSVWVGTLGGVLRRDPVGRWRKWTRLSGLPAHEARAIDVVDGTVTVRFSTTSAAWQEGQWQIRPLAAAPRSTGETCRAVWQGRPVSATLDGLTLGDGATAAQVPMPLGTTGTHISALLPHGAALWAALFGDGLWAWDGQAWTSVRSGLPPEAREITALALGPAQTLWVGTRHNGVFCKAAGHWAHFAQPDEPPDHNAEAVAAYHGWLFVSTLEQGLVVRGPQGWTSVNAPALSGGAPRQMAVFRDKVYVRQGSGTIDRFDGAHWTPDVFPYLPRRQASALAADGERLYVAQWGGWSEWDGVLWTHHLNVPELHGLPITALCPDGDTLWVGTQGRGLAEISRAQGTVRWHDERNGLPDDWVTCLTRSQGRVLAGTFVGGLARWDGTRWTTFHELAGQNVTALEADGASGVFIATRQGVWRLPAEDSPLQSLAGLCPSLDPEAQSLCAVPSGLWIGARTGIFFLPRRDLGSSNGPPVLPGIPRAIRPRAA